MRILIVEDDPQRIKKFRRNLGISFVWAKNVHEAKSYLRDYTPDWVFLDYDLYVHGKHSTGRPLREDDTGNGQDVARLLIKYRPTRGVIVHSLNPGGSPWIQKILQEANIPVWVNAFAWEDDVHLEHLVETGRWIAPPRLPE